MKLDVNVLRYLSKEDFRVLTAVEMGQKNHEIVPMPLIDSISGLKHGGAFRCLKTLLQHKLVHHEGQKYDGYRLTYMGYDFLAIKTLVARGHISGVGRQIGVGKESDIFEVTNDEGEVFRDVKSKRDYLGTRSNYSWLYLSRLAALKEFAFMKALGDHGFPVPVAIDNNRHAVLMELVDGQPLVQVRELAHPAAVYSAAMQLIHRLAARGLIHCDFNEFNLLIDDEETLTLIDFPQMVSVSHANAEELFDRDVQCIIRFFNKKIGYMPQLDESLPSIRPSFEAALAEAAAAGASGLDVELAASGFNKNHAKDLQAFLDGSEAEGDDADGAGSDSEDECEDDDDVDDSEECSSGSGDEAGVAAADADELAEQLTAAASCRASGHAEDGSRQHPQLTQKSSSKASSSTHRWLEQHAAGAVAADAVAAAATVEAAADASSSDADAAADSGSEQLSGEEGDTVDAQAAAAAAAARAARAAARQQQGGLDGEGSVAPSRAATDISFMGREVQLRLVQQRQKAEARAVNVKASRNVSKAKGKKARKTAAAMADW
ncbi:Serine/threonine-protein kinase RIO2 [Scenedesmus sp. NREL 46B-D3]|nr:Serine/threonine-protein kinase RIO2 [Scenedesmus sp. NREL 46B-D3]